MSETSKERQMPSATTSEAARTPSKRGHAKRFWWAYLLAFLAIATVIIVPSVILVAVPRLAQKRVDAASLTVDGVAVVDTRAASFTMAINATIRSPHGVRAHVDAFNGTLYLVADPPVAFTQMRFPAVTSGGGAQTVNVSHEISLSSSSSDGSGDGAASSSGLSSFTEFTATLLQEKSVDVRIVGYTHVHVPGIDRAYAVTFNKTVSLAGLDGFAGLSVSDPHLSLTSKNNFKGTVHIPNPSVLTLDVGNITFANYLNGSAVGSSVVYDVTLSPGTGNDSSSNNAFALEADIETLAVLKALKQPPYCGSGDQAGVLPLQLSGSNVTNDGQELAYFAKALGAHNMTVSIDTGIDLPCAHH
ncbi:hypothetical protein GGR56DRAFT_597701 [Xylariaceae sp. FL0804]|nr:hypothetical protein GGR56DRAFT_597701 [Xylariaceae sp. FL0804]